MKFEPIGRSNGEQRGGPSIAQRSAALLVGELLDRQTRVLAHSFEIAEIKITEVCL